MMDAQFASLTDQIDTTNSRGWLVFQTFNVLVEYEHDRIAERTLAGLAAARTRGHKGGRPTKLTGAALERAGQQMCERCLPIDEIAHSIGVSRPIFYYHLTPDGSLRKQATA